MFVLFIKRIYFPEPWIRLPFPNGAAPFFAGSQLAMFAGILLGWRFYLRDPVLFGSVLVIFGALGALIVLIPFLLSIFYTLPSFATRDNNMLFMMGYAYLMFIGLVYLEADTSVFRGFSYPYPWVFLISPLLGYCFGEWLVKPYKCRDLVDPGQPRKVRRELILAVLTLSAPFGGLAAPWWIHRYNAARATKLRQG
jgi:hypothetical protein